MDTTIAQIGPLYCKSVDFIICFSSNWIHTVVFIDHSRYFSLLLTFTLIYRVTNIFFVLIFNSFSTHSGYAGASSCMIMASFGSAWGTWKAGMGVCEMGIDYPKGIIKNIVPIVMAGVLGI